MPVKYFVFKSKINRLGTKILIKRGPYPKYWLPETSSDWPTKVTMLMTKLRLIGHGLESSSYTLPTALHKYINQFLTHQPIMLAAPAPLKRKENKSKWCAVICNDNFYFRQESLWRKDRNMHKRAKCQNCHGDIIKIG